MSPWWLASWAAHAAPGLDVMTRPALLRSAPVTAREETLDVFGLALEQRLAPEETGLGGRGLALELSGLLASIEPHRWVMSIGATQGRQRFEPAGGSPGLALQATTTELHLTTGLMLWFTEYQVPTIDGYAVVMAGVHGSWLSASSFAQTQGALAPQLTVGMGVASRDAPVRVRVEGRFDLVPHFSPGRGRAELPSSALTWSWYPGSAAVSLLVGVGFGGTRE